MIERPDYKSYHQSLSNELYSRKDRIRNLVEHWPTDGEYKEVALRSLLRTLLPESVIVGRGFIVAAGRSSTQIDVLIVDGTKPTLFKDGDLLIVTPDAVLGVIEVKTRLITSSKFASTLAKLSQIKEMCLDVTRHDRVWTGLFIYEGARDLRRLQKKALKGIGLAYQNTEKAVNCICCGKNVFVRYWNCGEDVRSKIEGPVWHSYKLPKVAPSYFIGNLVDWVSSIDDSTVNYAWFPLLGGKERFREHYLAVGSDMVNDFH